jgi:DNA-binding PadR family transcriptional regulator
LGDPNGHDIHLPARDERLDLARRRVLSSVRKLRQIRLTLLQAEIIDRLIDGRRTGTELVLEIFATRPGDEGFEAYYSRVRRDLRDMEKRGYASTSLFGRDKPYHITPHGLAALLSIIPDIGETRLIRRREVVSFSATALAGAALWISRAMPDPGYTIVLASFFTLLGISVTAFAGILRRVV